jgi:hypothetical protein
MRYGVTPGSEFTPVFEGQPNPLKQFPHCRGRIGQRRGWFLLSSQGTMQSDL